MKSWNVQLAYALDDHPIAPNSWFTLTQKLNGVRGVFYRGEIIGRNGTQYTGLEHITKALAPYGDMVFDGELVLTDPGTLTDGEAFRVANGTVRRKNGEKPELSLVIFDAIPVDEFERGESRMGYRERREFLDELAPRLSGVQGVNVLSTLYQGNDQAVIAPMLQKVTLAGKEGLMVNLDTAYLRRRNRGILKAKKFYTMDLPILRCEIGDGDFCDTLGSLVVDFNGNEVGVGTGFTREQRDNLWLRRETLPGTLCEVRYKEVSANNHGGQSLQFPVFISLREDKKEVSCA